MTASTAYYADKALLFRNATPDSRWVTNADDPDVQAMIGTRAGDALPVLGRASEPTPTSIGDTGQLVVLGHPLIHRDELPLLGDHNVANALAASLAVMIADRAHRTAARVDADRRRVCARSARSSTGSSRSATFGGVHVDQRLQVDQRRVDARRAARHDAGRRCCCSAASTRASRTRI